MTTWWEAEPGRLEQDVAEVSALFPDLEFVSEGAGLWRGRLPVWPFERGQPVGLALLTDGAGIDLEVHYRQAYPVVPPKVVPLDPNPGTLYRANHRWHLNGDGSLCLLRSEALWTPRESLVGLLLKAAGWRVEYELVNAGVIEAMSENGIVSDPVHDDRVREAAWQPSASS